MLRRVYCSWSATVGSSGLSSSERGRHLTPLDLHSGGSWTDPVKPKDLHTPGIQMGQKGMHIFVKRNHTDDWCWCSPVYSDSKHWEDISFINYLVTQWLHMNTEDIGVGDCGEEKLFFFFLTGSQKRQKQEKERIKHNQQERKPFQLHFSS